MRKSIFSTLTFLFLFNVLCFSQNVIIEGYAYEENDRGFLNEVKIEILEKSNNAIRGEAFSNMEGFFTLELPAGRDYILRGSKKVFKNHEQIISTKGYSAGKKLYLKVEMGRKPGYIFDVTMAERRQENEVVDAVQNSLIEVYNNTKKEETLVLKEYLPPNFNVTFEQGNHYTLMIRKKGFFTKRMEAYVNIEGCILCFDGVGGVRPGVSDVMTRNNTMGTLLANVELDRVDLNKTIEIENIYYDLAKYAIREDAAAELDKLLVTLKDNPSIIVELGSHTDSRGKDKYNLDLSQKRAEAAVEYLVAGGIDGARISAKGYGETKLVNECRNGVKCSERRHQLNRRTELKIVGFLDNDPYANMSLKEIIVEENFMKMLDDVQNQEVIELKEGQELPDEIKKQIKKKDKQIKEDVSEKPQVVVEEKEPEWEVIETKTSAQDAVRMEKEKMEIERIDKERIERERKIADEKIRQRLEEDRLLAKEKAQMEEEQRLAEAKAKTKRIEKMSAEPIEIIPQAGEPSGKVVSAGDLEKMLEGPNGSNNQNTNSNSSQPFTEDAPPNLKMVPPFYSGFKVEVLSAASKLPKSHKLFLEFGSILIEETKEGKFAYLIGDFKDKKDAILFLNSVVKNRYPKSNIVRYFEGRRIVN